YARPQPDSLWRRGLQAPHGPRQLVLLPPPRLLAVPLPAQSTAVGDGKLGDQPPDPDQVTGRAFDPEPAVEVEHEGADLVAQDADALEPEMPLRFLGRRKQHARFHRECEPVFVL